MPKNVMKMLKPSPTLGRNAFDMSQRVVQSINFGELLPVYCLETVPADKITISCADLIRAQPLVTSSFLRAKQHIDFWFVPYQQLWSRWNDFVTSRNEPSSAALKHPSFVPCMNLKEIASFLYSVQSGTDVVGHDFRLNACRLLDALGYPMQRSYFQNWNPASGDTDVYVNAWRLAAYHKIWYSEYRQKYYDSGNLGFPSDSPTYYQNVAAMFNFDDLDCDTFANSDILQRNNASQSPLHYLLQMRYRCWKKDLGTGLMPSTQLGAVSVVDAMHHFDRLYIGNIGVDTVPGMNIQVGITSKTIEADNAGSQKNLFKIWTNTGDKIISGFDILALRRNEALQKWRESALRAGNQIEDNYEAHYGVKPKSHLDVHPIFIGSYDAPLNIGDVEASAATGATVNGSVGDIAGKGISSVNGHDLHFQTNDFGVVMGILSILPEAEYMSTGIDRPNQLLEQFDYFYPEFENLGLEAVDKLTFDVEAASGAAGYAPRYWCYKQKVDQVHLDFFNRTNQQGVFANWCAPKNIASNIGITALKNLYVDSDTFNVNFAVPANKQFIADLFFDVSAIRPLSVTGMPGY